MKRLHLVIFLFSLILKISASTPKDTFKLANEALERGDVDDAIQLYQSILSEDYGSAAIYYNLASAYIKRQNWASARFYLEKGLQESPLHPSIQKNLNYVRTQLDDQYNFPSFPFTNFIQVIHHSTSQHLVSTLLLLLFVAGLTVMWIKPFRWKIYFYLLLATWTLTAGVFLLELHYLRNNHQLAIVWNEGSKLFDKPESNTESFISLRAGFKVRILEQISDWRRVDLADGTVGWMKATDIKTL